MYCTGTDGGQNLPELIILSPRRRRRCTVACHGRLQSGLPRRRRPDMSVVRQNVKHFDVFMTASANRGRL